MKEAVTEEVTEAAVTPSGDAAVIAANIAGVRQRILTACERAGRAPDDVTLIAVTKTQPPQRIASAYAAGLRDFGENYLQEAQGKIGQPGLDWPDARWHFIGHLQSNKARSIVALHQTTPLLLQSLDSIELAREVARRAIGAQTTVPVLLEVKLDDAPAKFGFDAERVLDDMAQIAQIDGLQVRGLMGIAPFASDPEMARPHFRRLAGLYAQMPPDSRAVLSMGMTGDFEVAIEEGATHVRIGTAIFGSRAAKP